MKSTTWFICKCRYGKILDNGMKKEVTEPYLVDALGFSEAEDRMVSEVATVVRGEFVVSTAARFRCEEIFHSDADGDDLYWKAKLNFPCLDEKTGMEKNTYKNVIIQADKKMDHALKRLHECMKGTMADYEVVKLELTNIQDVFHYVQPETQSEDEK